MTRLLLPALLLAGSLGCVWTDFKAGPYRLGANLSEARLESILTSPSPEGTEEAMKAWGSRPKSERARDAVFAALPEHIDTVQNEYGRLDAENQIALLDRVGTLSGEEASAFSLAVLPQSAPNVQLAAVRSLAGRQDATAIEGLTDLARNADTPGLRKTAIESLHPAIEPLALSTLTELVAKTDDSDELRLAALHSLRPHDHPDARSPLTAFAGEVDDTVAAATFDALRYGRDDAELEAGLAGTAGEARGAAATRFLGASTPWAGNVRGRLHELAADERDPVRWEAAAALVAGDDAVGGAPMVAFLDDEARGADARDALDSWELGALDALRGHADSLGTATGKGRAAELLADIGGPDDAELLAKLGAEPVAIDQLATAPYGLFPDGSAVWGDAGSLSAKQAPLRDAVGQLRDEAAAEGISKSNHYVALARAWAVGGRSDAGRAAAVEAAAAVRSEWTVPLVLAVETSGDFADVVLREEAPGALRRGVKAPLSVEGARAHLPHVQVDGTLSCTSNTDEGVSTQMGSQRIDFQMPNPEKDSCLTWLSSIPPNDTQCRVSCNRTTGGDPHSYLTSDCSAGVGRSGYTCTYTTESIPNPAYERAAAQCDAIPDTYTATTQRDVQDDHHTKTTTTSCNGELTAALGSYAATAPVSFEGDRVETWTIRTAPSGTLPNGDFVEAMDVRLHDNVTDARRENFANRVASALSGLSVSEAQVRALYGKAVGPAVQARAGDAAVEALLVADPERLDIESAAFRQTFLGDGAEAFPFAWKGR